MSQVGGTITGTAGNDIIDCSGSSVAEPRAIFGLDGDDILIGGPGPDQIDGGPGNDVLDGRGGSDLLIGGTGLDTASYASRDGLTLPIANVSVDVFTGVVAVEPSEGDLFLEDVEIFVGGWGNDSFHGNVLDQQFFGGPGDDVLVGGGGNDVLEGQGGCDTVNGVLDGDPCATPKQGPAGPAGPAGSNGATGPQGPSGPPGSDALLLAGSAIVRPLAGPTDTPPAAPAGYALLGTFKLEKPTARASGLASTRKRRSPEQSDEDGERESEPRSPSGRSLKPSCVIRLGEEAAHGYRAGRLS